MCLKLRWLLGTWAVGGEERVETAWSPTRIIKTEFWTRVLPHPLPEKNGTLPPAKMSLRRAVAVQPSGFKDLSEEKEPGLPHYIMNNELQQGAHLWEKNA